MEMETGLVEVLRQIAVVLLFALCGYLSAANLLATQPWDFPNGPSPMFLPIPFAILCGLNFLHTIRAALALPLMLGVWFMSYVAATWAGMFISVDVAIGALAPGCVGGLIGSFGLSLCAAVAFPSLLLRKNLLRGALVGLISGLSFAPWVSLYKQNLMSGPPAPPVFAFAIWQAAMGTYMLRTELEDDALFQSLQPMFDGYLEANELELALHVACDALLEQNHNKPSTVVFGIIEDCHKTMDLQDDCAERLLAL
jgi:hypothetical protein